MKVAGSLKVCVWQEVGAEAVIHEIHHIFKDQNKQPFYLLPQKIYLNRKAMLHNISVICPMTSTYINNCYNTPVQ